MNGQGKGYEVIHGEGKAEPEHAEKVLKILLQDERLKLNPCEMAGAYINDYKTVQVDLMY